MIADLLDINWNVFGAMMSLVVLGGVLAAWDDHWNRAQVVAASGRPQDYSFLEHPILIIDTALSYLAAYLYPRYHFDVESMWGILVMLGTLVVVLVMTRVWRAGGVEIGDHCTHGGVDTWAGYVHDIFFYGMLFFFLEIYLRLTTPAMPARQLIWLSIFFTFFFPLGVIKISTRWHWTPDAKMQVAGLVSAVWAMTGLWHFLGD